MPRRIRKSRNVLLRRFTSRANRHAIVAIWKRRSRISRASAGVPDSDIRATAEYDAAAALINLQAWDRASGVLEQFRADYPDSEFADDITQKLAVTIWNPADSRRLPPSSSASPMRTRALKMCDGKRSGRRPSCTKKRALAAEQRVLDDILDAIRIHCPNRLRRDSACWKSRGRRIRAEVTARLEELVAVDATAGAQRSDRTRFLAAIASLELADPVRRRFEVVKLSQPLADSLKLKKVTDGRCHRCLYRRSGIRRCRSHDCGDIPPRRGL